MRTLRRFGLALFGIVFLIGGYLIYAQIIGWIDGLPPLPSSFVQRATDNDQSAIPSDTNSILKRIQQAFGANAPELFYVIKIDNHKQGLLIVANEMTHLTDRKIQLTPCSLAIFNEPKKRNSGSEETIVNITSTHCDRAILEFDKPLSTTGKSEKSELVAVEMQADAEVPGFHPHKGMIRIFNNRGSASSKDGIEILTKGPVFYNANAAPNTPQVTCDNTLEVIDHQNRPDDNLISDDALVPTITAIGLKMYLNPNKLPNSKAASKTPAPPKTTPGKPVDDNILEKIELLSNVTMNFFVDQNSSFLSSNMTEKKNKNTAQEQKKENIASNQKSHIEIQTFGPFIYDFRTSTGLFKKAEKINPLNPNYVQVIRRQPNTPNQSMMNSEYLEVEFDRDNQKKPTPEQTINSDLSKDNSRLGKEKKSSSNGMQIKKVHAWGQDKEYGVSVFSDDEDLVAYGRDLTHDMRLRKTILKGDSFRVIKEGNQITGKELSIVTAEDNSSQNLVILGPGQIDSIEMDAKTNLAINSRQIIWREVLVYKKIPQYKDGTINLNSATDQLTLQGGAKIIDLIGKQQLVAKQIKIWMVPKQYGLKTATDGIKTSSENIQGNKTTGKNGSQLVSSKGSKKSINLSPEGKSNPNNKRGQTKSADKSTTPGAPGSSLRPQRLEAQQDVQVDSSELILRDGQYLNMWFTEEPPLSSDLVATKNAEKSTIPNINPGVGKMNGSSSPSEKSPPEKPMVVTKPVSKQGITLPNENLQVNNPPTTKKMENNVSAAKADLKKSPDLPKPPIQLRAQRTETFLVMRGNKTDLRSVQCDGKVNVHQDRTEATPQGIDLVGDHFVLNHQEEGNILTLTEKMDSLGEVHYNDLHIYGRDIVINQLQNSAAVKGLGSMKLRTATTLDGETKQKMQQLEVVWSRSMEFKGTDQFVVFDGRVQAKQGETRILCENMQVSFDRPIYLNNLQKDSTPKNGSKKETDNIDDKAKIDRVICDSQNLTEDNHVSGKVTKRPVIFIDRVIKENVLVSQQYLETSELEFDNLRRKVIAPKGGILKLFSEENNDILSEENSPDSNEKGKNLNQNNSTINNDPNKKAMNNTGKDRLEMVLTIVHFQEQMQAQTVTSQRFVDIYDKQSRTKRRILEKEIVHKNAKFFGPVDVVRAPATSPNEQIDVIHLPVGGLRLKCDKLLDLATRNENNFLRPGEVVPPDQSLQAEGNVETWRDDFKAEASRMKYNQKQKMIIFEGEPGKPAIIRQIQRKGLPEKTFESDKLFYNVKTKDLRSDGGRSISDQ